MSSKRFTKDHEWIEVDGDVGTVGISDYAQHALGDVVFVEVPEPGRVVAKGAEAAVVESVKAASEVYSPVSGTVTAGNQAIVDQPGLVNEAAEGAAWFFKLTLSNPGEVADLMDQAAYDAYLKTLE
ncbi:glycine cleavage system protein GcvH [Paramagnetospirillum magneticum]|uniref:Glycine cleavage system H protein n=1 Tax=Paramagnetospirillum magneticum (strain ATCC 700264 / AMB-1) TaxID=342108 RepID=GCSH_PARM1|nr:glycine cleavage system protein GcvH [Paramagnetospirillum magneticum]Q2W9A4.1 RecName: Full=Glycine cleavage system H protein [Paramagnetospirillum magneticum AMB-1]BAE49571.1 Glycine cleavage system H protein [Paramagnetospirillum magneticum AMB-1]